MLKVDFFQAIEQFVGRWVTRILGFILFLMYFSACMYQATFGGLY